MTSAASPSSPRAFAPALREETVCWAAGFAFTFALFFAMARLQNAGGTSSRGPEILDIPMVALPLEAPPPPRPSEPAQAQEALPPLTGIDFESTGSPVRIAVPPPDLVALMPDQRIRIPAAVSVGRTTVKPQIGVERIDARHVYLASEVDRQPEAVVRVAPAIWPAVYEWGPAISVVLLLRIDADGQVEDVRVIQSCGHADFDAVVAETVRDQWQFSAAIRHGRKVRCLVQQKFTLAIEAGSAFSVH